MFSRKQHTTGRHVNNEMWAFFYIRKNFLTQNTENGLLYSKKRLEGLIFQVTQ